MSYNVSIRNIMDKPVSINLQLQKTHVIDAETARASVLIESVFHKHINEENLASAVEKAFPHTRYLANSIHRLSEKNRNLFGIYLGKQRKIMDLEQASAEGLVAINDTVYQDTNDAIWTVVRDGETSYLATQVEDNINDLLGGLHIRAVATASHGLVLEEDYSAGNSVLYYDLKHAEKAFGIAIDGANVYNPDRNTIVPVEAAQVLIVDDVNKIKLEISASMQADKKELLDYMQMLYGHNPSFFAEIKEIITKHTAV